MATSEEINAILSHMSPAGSPDSNESPGAVWAGHVFDAVSEAWDTDRFGDDSSEIGQDVISELSDGVVPVYTHERWRVFVDLCGYADDDADDVVEIGGDLTGIAGGILMRMSERAMDGWVAERIEEMPEDDDDDELPPYMQELIYPETYEVTDGLDMPSYGA